MGKRGKKRPSKAEVKRKNATGKDSKSQKVQWRAPPEELYGLERILFLQRNIGNRAVQRLLSDKGRKEIAHQVLTPIAQRQDQSNEASAGSQTTGIQQGDEALRREARRIYEEGVQFYESRQFRRAIIRFERARQMPGITDDIRGPLLYNIGRANLRLERFATAVTAFEGFLATPGISADDASHGRALLAEAQRGAGVGGEVSQADGRQLFQEASQQYLQGQFRRAIILFERSRHTTGMSEEGQADILFNIGRCNLRLQRFATAIRNFEATFRAKGLEPDGAAAVEAAARDPKLAQSLEFLRQARQGAGIPWGPILFRQIQALYQAGNYAAALQRLQQLYDSPDLDQTSRNQVIYNLGITNHRLNNYNEAVRYYRQFLSQSTDDTENARVRARLQEAQAQRAPQGS